MKLSMRKSIAAVSAAALVAAGVLVSVPAANAAAPTCTTDKANLETCTGKLANGAGYVFKMPANFKGTMFFWEHGFRSTYPVPGVATVPTGVEEITPASQSTGKDITKEMMLAGYGAAAYDGTVQGLRGWNNTYRVEMLKEVIDTAMAKYGTKIQKKVVYGSSQAGTILTPFIEKYPTYADAVGILAGNTPSPADSVQSACDIFYILSVFADPTIKGCTAFGTKGVPGFQAAVGELLKVVALLKAWQINSGVPGLEYPAALKGSPIPQRSALLLTGLLSGVPTKSAHMDGISTSALVPEHSINATVAILENMGEAVATGVLAGQSMSEITGPGFYDNTKTNWAALLDEADSGRYNLGLSGDEGIAAMLGVLSMAPRVAGDAAAIAKFKALDKSSFTSTKPTILISNEADRLVFPGNSSRYVDRKREVYEKALASWEKTRTGKKPIWNTLALYAMTPETYTKFTATGAPDLTAAPAVSGVGHQAFTTKQMKAWVDMLAVAAKSGKVPTNAYVQYIAEKVPYLNGDIDYRPADLKYDFGY
ncbi:hypothetical protein [Candidatus Planktophila versatilis]|uniref:hypothetical protein n=1 Tax=Candidatus Planktophila versatilis TaxID=1884905 RepID=UPI000BACDE8F|nr:hypothetical protein [Candidatus Planktophila versatilis]ASY26740.1 hypothetical protein A1sIIB142_05070 [Candidatus Planktophila versatilis]